MTPHCPSPVGVALCLTGTTSSASKKFSTSAYQAIDNIYYFSLPSRTGDDDGGSHVDFDDKRNFANPPYPSYLWGLSGVRAR